MIMPVHGPGTALPRPGRSPLRAPPARDRFVADLMAEMSIEEKVGQLTGVVLGPSGVARPVDGPTPGVVLVGPRPLTAMARDLAEAQTRIRATAHRPIPALAVALHEPTDLPALPPTLARAATWDTDLVAELAAATAGPLAAAGIHATAGLSVAPALRRAGWADVAGSLGSDPVLAAELVRAHVYGLQGGGPPSGPAVARSPRSSPTSAARRGRRCGGSTTAGRNAALRTTVLPASESAIRAGAALVLPAAAANDGIPLHADSRLLQQVLRAEWGFTGVVMASADDVLGLAERHHVAETADAALALAIESGVHVVFGPDGPRARRRRRHRAPDAAPARRGQAGELAGGRGRGHRPAAQAGHGALRRARARSRAAAPPGAGGARGPGRRPVGGAAHRPARGAPHRRVGPDPRGRGRPDGRDARAGRRVGRRHPGGARAVDPAEVAVAPGRRPSSWWSTTRRGRRSRSAGWSPPARRASRSWAAPTRGCSLRSSRRPPPSCCAGSRCTSTPTRTPTCCSGRPNRAGGCPSRSPATAAASSARSATARATRTSSTPTCGSRPTAARGRRSWSSSAG